MAQIEIPNYPPNNAKAAQTQAQNKQNPGNQPQPTMVIKPMADMKPRMEKKSPKQIVNGVLSNERVVQTRNTAIDKIIMPNLQKTLFDVGSMILRAIIFKDQAITPTSYGYNPFAVTGTTNYAGFYNQPVQVTTGITQTKAMTRNETLRVHDLIFPTESQCDYVKAEMENTIQQYGHVTAAFVNTLTGRSSGISATANDYGWRDLTQAYKKPEAGGWMLVLPEAQKLTS